MIILDTGCIDFLFDGDTHKNFQDKIKIIIDEGGIVTTTILNLGEKKSGFIHYSKQSFIKKDTQYKIYKILDFFNILLLNNDLLFITEKTTKIYAEIHYKLKSSKSNNIQKGEIKNMHNDIWIAALCIENNAVLYTKNTKDFEKIQNIDERLKVEYIS